MKDNGIKIINGVREGGDSWKQALAHGFIENKDFFSIGGAVKRATIVMYLLSDAGQAACWPEVRDNPIVA